MEGPERQVVGQIHRCPPSTSDATTPRNQTASPLDLIDFLHAFPPSQCSTADLACVCLRDRGPANAYDPPEASVDQLLAAFDAHSGPRPSRGAPVSAEHIWSLAQRFGIRGGKWMVFIQHEMIDAVWKVRKGRSRTCVDVSSIQFNAP